MIALDRVTAVLDEHHISHALIGAAALAARGIARSTYDIDLLTTDLRVLDPGVWDTLPPDAVDIRRGDAEDPLAGVIRISLRTDRPVDVVVGKHPWQERAVVRAEAIAGSTRVVLARDLVLLKLYAGGTQDLWDVRELLALGDTPLREEVTADLAALPKPLQQLWATLQHD
jgi:hypothetical protein